MSTGAAKVILQEWDYSTRVPSFPGVYGAIVLPAKKGQVSSARLVTSETNFLKMFTPDETIKVGYDLGHYDAVQFLSKTNKLWVVRAAVDALHGGVYLAQDAPIDTFKAVANLGLHAFTLRQVTAEEVETSKLVWSSLTNGDVVTVSPEVEGGTLPAPLSANTTYYLIKYSEDDKQVQLAYSLEDAYNDNIIHLDDVGSGGVVFTVAGSSTKNGELEYGLSDPDTYQLDSSDGKQAGQYSEFTVDMNYSALNVVKAFWDTCATGDSCTLTASTFPEVSGGAPFDASSTYYIIKLEEDDTGVYKVQLARSESDALSGIQIDFITEGDISITLTNKISASAGTVNYTTDAIEVSPEFYNAVQDGTEVMLTTSGTLPAVDTGNALNVSTPYFIIKGVSPLVQLSRTVGGTALDFSDAGTGTMTITASKVVYQADTITDLSSDVLTVSETFYEAMEDGYEVTVESDGVLPDGLVAGKTYYLYKDASGVVGKVRLATNYGNALNDISVDVLDMGTGSHTMYDKHNHELSGLDRKCMLIYTATPTDEEIYVKTLHYPYGDEANWTDDEKVAATTVGIPGCFLLYVYKKNSEGEYYEAENPWLLSRELSKLDGYGTNIYCETAIQGSNYVRIKDNTAIPSDILPADQGVLLKLTKGSVGGTVTDSVMVKALDTLRSKRNYSVTVVMDGGWATPAYGKAIINLCEFRQDCVGLLSVPISRELSADYLNEIVAYRKSDLNANTSYAALYTPHLKITDKYNNREIFVSPTGYVAGVISDNSTNYEMWYAPAGPRYGVLSTPLDVARRFNEGDLDHLYNNGINPIDYYEGRGIRVWGQKTLLSKASALDRLNVRLMLIVIEPAISEFLEDYLFEINDDLTRRLVKSGIESYMEDIKARRGVYDYMVKCDDDNNTPEAIDANELHVWLYVKPTKSIEWIKFRVILTRTGASFDAI